ncbi:MAG: hypothetical protein LH465_09355 [Sphingomonas bacterium]|nr:hypothetical protein [Sphingomonas bacterium]
MRHATLIILLLIASCADQRPPAPSVEESARLDEAEAMLDNLDQPAD